MEKCINIDKISFLSYNNIVGRDTLYTRATELTFKRRFPSSVTGTTVWWFFLQRKILYEHLYLFSDESGVFDYIHNNFFVYGGIILIGEQEKTDWTRKYAHVESVIRKNHNYSNNYEIKATTINNTDKNKIFRSLNQCHKFGVIIDEQRVIKNIWSSKKDKQRYLDFVYKISVKRALQDLISEAVIIPNEIDRLYFYVDEHTTATNGRYELRESLEQEFKYGTYNLNYSSFFPPIFPDLKDVCVEFCDSSAPNRRLVRAADIVANKIYSSIVNGKEELLLKVKNLTYIRQS